MKLIYSLLFAAMLIFPTASQSKTVTITEDRGGVITKYLRKYQAWSQDGTKVRIDGYCASACTVALGLIPPNNLCATKRAVFGFHGAWTPVFLFFGQREYPEGTHLMTDHYPKSVNDWLNAKGGLKTYKIMFLMRYPETAKHVRICQ